MLILGIALGLVLGIAAGGDILRLASIRLRWPILLFGALALRLATEVALDAGAGWAEALRLPLFATSFGILLAGLWVNRSLPGFSLAFVGTAANGVAVVVNGGAMPVWLPSLEAAGFSPDDVVRGFHTILPAAVDASFVLSAGMLGDIIPIPVPIFANVASLGDLFIAGGLAFFLFATVVRTPQEIDDASRRLIDERLRRIRTTVVGGLAIPAGPRPGRSETNLAPGLAEASVLERPFGLGGASSGGANPARSRLPFEAPPPTAATRTAEAAERAIARARRHPYVRLALNPAFSALWLGHVISLLGDRVHQLALAFLVYDATGSPAAVGAVFFAAALPNLVLAPVAGAFVDRWDHRRVMIAADLARAGIVFLVPIAAMTNLVLVYPLVFGLTVASMFFRPARVAILPRIVRRDELLTANSATWIAETLADVVGYPLTGLFVAFLGTALPIAFWLDSASYVASALLIASVVVPPLARANRSDGDEPGEAGVPATTDTGPRRAAARRFGAEIAEGWSFLRGEVALLANTIQATVGQFTIGIMVALTPIYAADVLDRGTVGATAAYSFLEAGIGVGNLVGGVAMGLIGARIARGRSVIVGYAAWGLATTLLAFTDHLGIAIGLMVGSGIANMVFVIPSQTMFQERTPAELIGRVISLRFGLVFGAMTVAMGLGGVLGQAFGVPVVIGVFGIVTLAAGLAGLLVPALRDA